MKCHVKRWVQQSASVPDIGTPKTTVTVYGNVATVAVTLNGKLTRKEAINQTYHHLLREGRWSRDFLFQLKSL